MIKYTGGIRKALHTKVNEYKNKINKINKNI